MEPKISIIAKISLIPIVLLSLTGCFTSGKEKIEKYEQKYAKDEEIMIKHLEDKYGLDIGDTNYVVRARTNDDIIGYFFDKKDNSFGVQVRKTPEGKMEDDGEDFMKIYNARQQAYESFKKHKPDNMLNDYLGLNPNGIWGPFSTSSFEHDYLTFGVMKDKIDIDKELESDYQFVKEVMKIYKKEFPESTFRGVDVIYMEKGDFDLEKFEKESFEGIFNFQDQDRSPLIFDMSDEDAHKVIITDIGYKADIGGGEPYFEDNAKPTRVFRYKILNSEDESEFKVNSVEEYKQLAYKNKLADQYK